jgi:PKD repeat protein
LICFYIRKQRVSNICFIGTPTPGQFHVQFTGTPRSGKAPLLVQFNDTSLGGPISWYWQFGDGKDSTDQNLEQIFLVSGNYSVLLQANNGKTGGNLLWDDYVRVI